MKTRKTIKSPTAWEDRLGYSRAVRVGNMVFVAGTTAVNEYGEVVGRADSYEQARYAFEKIERALKEAGAELKHVVRTRMYLSDIRCWESVGKAHAELFADIRPAATMVEVNHLIHPDLMVEIEVEAVIP
ncbi:MAG: RidA family protein [Bacteroidia bacterium]|nr:RidA family protein [Bacteroidia bacterium]